MNEEIPVFTDEYDHKYEAKTVEKLVAYLETIASDFPDERLVLEVYVEADFAGKKGQVRIAVVEWKTGEDDEPGS